MRLAWPWSLSALEHGAFVATGLLVYVVVTRIGQQRRHPSAAIGWVLGIAAFPYVGLPLFLIFGTRKFTRPCRQRAAAPAVGAALAPAWAATLLASMGIEPARRNSAIDFHADGEASLQALLNLCGSATQELAVGTFVLGDDEVGATVERQLTAAAARGVRTRILIDAVGSMGMPRSATERMRSAGVQVLRFMPLLHNPMRGRTNLRNHRKLAVADGTRLWAGGRNLAAEYFRARPGRPAWTDLSFSAAGPLAQDALAQFDGDWHLAGGPVEGSAQRAAATPADCAGAVAQWVPTGPDQADDTVHALLLAATYHATDRILAVTPYFVPDEVLLEAWCTASRRGVRLRLVLPRRSNHRLADLARERALRRLVQAGAEVRLVEGMVHAKAMIFDNGLALCGSVNLDGRSLFLNYEAMAAFYGAAEIGWLARWIEALGERGSPHRGEMPSLPRDVLEGVVRSVGFQL